MNIRTIILITAIQFLFIGCGKFILISGKPGCTEKKECDYVLSDGAEKIVAIRSVKPFTGILAWDMPKETQDRIKAKSASSPEEKESIYTCEFQRLFYVNNSCRPKYEGFLDYGEKIMSGMFVSLDDSILAAKNYALAKAPETTHISYNFPEVSPGKRGKIVFTTYECPEGVGEVILNKDLAKLEEDLVFDPNSVTIFEDEQFAMYGLGGKSWSSCQKDRENFIESLNEKKAELKKEEDELKKEEEEIMKE